MSNHNAPDFKQHNMDLSLFNLPALPPSVSESLASGTSIPPPSPSPPPSRNKPITTPDKQNTFPRHPSTPPNGPLASPSPAMPGAFPPSPTPSPKHQQQTPQTSGKAAYTASAYASTPAQSTPITPNSRSPKRPNGLRNLLSFKRSHTASPDSLPSPSSHRPASSGGFSMVSSFRPSLSVRKSGSFWSRRKSSLGMYPDGNGQTGLSSPEINGHDTVYEDEAEHKGPIKAFTTPERDMPTLGKRKSGTYWRRKSSLTLNAEARNGYFPQGVNENGTAAKRENETVSPALEETPVVARSWSPAPILPEVNLTQDSRFLDADDMFKNIG